MENAEAEEVLVVEEELFRGAYPVSVAKLVEEEEEQKRGAAERKEARRAEAMEELKKVVPGYEERLGLASHWNEEKQEWSQDKFGKPEREEQSKAMWNFWRRFEFPEGLIESAQRSGTGAGRSRCPPRGREEKREQEWTKRTKYYRVSRRLLKPRVTYENLTFEIEKLNGLEKDQCQNLLESKNVLYRNNSREF